MKNQLEKIKKDFFNAVTEVKDALQLEELEQRFFSRRSGELTQIMKNLKDLSGEARQEFGKLANEVKRELEEVFAKKKEEIKVSEMGDILEREKIDVTQPKLPGKERGHLHPNTLVQNDLEDLFTSMGFMALDGPELESEYYNFEALNIPADHPARDMQDTFYISAQGGSASGGKNSNSWVMRTHTSPMQARAMQKYGAPLRVVVPGRVFRNEATDARHEHTIQQLEGFVIDENINFSHLKGVLDVVAKHLYGDKIEIRLRPKFYPFVEPGVNGEVTCFLCAGKGCRVCKQSGWLEIFGAGMIHPNVLREGGIDIKKYQGFAFGFGLDRLVMLKYGIDEIRILKSGDLRFLRQF
ncbi:MAG: phenylalanine--tRNA ligase subunit alpha [Candidatus Magasanikbacteria bacterium RIFCSPLOWO2_01_FULL_43_20b]|uniref:Phenylalanine--tRNA ligase alpha subunit n=1 Tax=Candidatus Magasanikbacteria bacterium RIFCSPLOWO2_12_FULL_43_12 TaxID=1798692 RepID=A0A1F6MVN1_9BACT|nr:MAG: phenylalanine--tRNA ligase subunit alpha [Candidatus Magasanikbacteria bacterium RIFCSPHIGHO2_02_FULL_44_13]OGH72613.1 MAG: phenylalanine--tRNA ligase subunit alpha [Candidatus Magasanikbacteria bacterium RIFCSPLOWO2_02_FULL_43_22]OGH73214.1 MAG: phenylalanine--tRNA ligase subunit alpha [Candidatus Magasanikbacteria bacterium RIFCSPLOWO2_01_FULL_43_20b]OGH75550.1 MAG: phenylalanine--tRNA ligase subunit alpha [Candidatus Magasanikbacteria bacterium RIFCSPLOWO2_12_FULL_43_12]